MPEIVIKLQSLHFALSVLHNIIRLWWQYKVTLMKNRAEKKKQGLNRLAVILDQTTPGREKASIAITQSMLVRVWCVYNLLPTLFCGFTIKHSRVRASLLSKFEKQHYSMTEISLKYYDVIIVCI